MKLAAARAIASSISEDRLNKEYFIPSIFDKAVARRVADAVALKADETGMACRKPRGANDGSETGG